LATDALAYGCRDGQIGTNPAHKPKTGQMGVPKTVIFFLGYIVKKLGQSQKIWDG